MGFITERLATLSNIFQGQVFPNKVFWTSIISWDFWKGNSIVSFSVYSLFLITLFVLFIVGLLIWRQRLIKLNKINKFYDLPIYQITFLATLFFFAVIIYAFSSSQALPGLSSPFVILALILISIIWVIAIIIYLLRTVPNKRLAQLEKDRFLRYIPKKKERI